MSYESMTLLELKKLCKDRGLKVSGNKDEVVIRLMEFDETSQSPKQIFTTPNITTTTSGQMPVNSQVVYGRMTSSGIVIGKKNETISTVGVIIILYGIFRMFWALVFAAFTSSGLGWVLAPVAFVIASMFIFGGVLMSNEYKNGIYFTFVTFLISGTCSILFTGDEMNPLSISLAEGGALIPLSMMCTMLGIGIAALPLLLSDDDLKEGWPPGVEKLMNRNSSQNKEVACPHCNSKLSVPVNYSGKISCPSCNMQSEI